VREVENENTHSEPETESAGQSGEATSEGMPAGITPEVAQYFKKLVDDARKNGYAEARRKQEQSEEKPRAKPERAKAEKVSEGIDQRKLRQFDRLTSKLDLSEKVLARMERHLEMDNPDDVSEWVTSYVEDLGLNMKSEKSNPNPNPSSTAKPVPQAAPQTGTPFIDAPQDPNKWNERQTEEFILREGGDARDILNPKNAKIWRKIADLYRQAGQRTRIDGSR
jgi:hypothetical protein